MALLVILKKQSIYAELCILNKETFRRKFSLSPSVIIKKLIDENSLLNYVPYQMLIGALLFLASRNKLKIMLPCC